MGGLTVIGIKILFMLTSHYRPVQSYLCSGIGGITNVIYAMVWLGVFATVLFLLIINNNWLIKKILQTEEPVPAGNQKKWLIVTLKISVMLCGLMLFAGNIQSVKDTILLITYLPFTIRRFIYDIFSGAVVGCENCGQKITKMIETAVIIYLIMGAPKFVEWKLNQRFKK